ncbi:hypothetical protein [Candidatus Bandiella numerosa]|uniref:hypothetical protein n=1 Tax=Candidatus Bandiella numerosa TaxID=2570586 RepID=UPI001F38370E|nr:hypothetical protein [Candidatus Bandiella numerosa]
MTNKKPKHKLSGIPTAYEETNKLISSKKIENIHEKIDELEVYRRKKDENAILEILNEAAKGKSPLVKLATIETNTFQEALTCLLSIRNTETFEVMMLLFEYMENHTTNKVEKLTGTELLRLSKVKKITQEMRHQKLNLLLNQASVRIKALNPQKSLENYKNKKTDKGLVYELFDLIRIRRVVYSKLNPEIIVRLEGIELLPNYLEYKHLISKRYLPLQTIRNIPERRGSDKSRHFIYKLCLKFASVKKETITLNITECMNLGGYMKRDDRNIKKKWKPVEKALLQGKKIGLIDFHWLFKEPSDAEKSLFNLTLFGEISNGKYNEDGSLYEQYYKYIKEVQIKRLYDLGSSINLPFDIEKVTPKKASKGIKIQI